ncbi:TonB-dependent receptor [Persicobacter psychrovividus]|uniref:SusC/RagA family TonB-linked outer membrane protein n=1 Tax=Persicobacter psychrovividus TaxID=387638 RepID=A0ABM7VIP0_9BACT|nr:SusC/RagA family TonB-linked outer membrane protein [Persicobacter psychrovividus]
MRSLLMLVALCLLSSISYAQSFTVKGVVTDEVGDPIPGVNVLDIANNNGTITDVNGQYLLQLPSNSMELQFSFVGMAPQTVAVGGRSEIHVQLQSAITELDNVLVVAYGTSTKEAFTGAAAVVDEKVLENRPVTSFEKALQGTTPGLMVSSSSGQPGASATVRIRGIGSLSASSSPLYVLDGVPMSGSLSDLNPNDIETVTVLKDASASSLYGSRAANGVIMITSKRGKKGKTNISFNSQVGVNQRISNGYGLMNSTDIYEHSWRGLYNRSLLDGNSVDAARAHAHGAVQETVGFNPFGVDQPLDNNGKLIPGTQVLTDTDWRDQVYKNGITQNHNLTISGGNDQTQLYFSLGYFADDGTVISSNFNRITSKININHRINDVFTSGIRTQLSYSKAAQPPGGTGGANPVRSAEIINAASPVYNPDGSYNWDNKAIFDFNPLGLAELDQYGYTSKAVMANMFIQADFLEHFNFRSTLGIDQTVENGLSYYNPFHGNGRGVDGRSSKSNYDLFTWNLSNILTYRQEWQDHHLEVLAGQEAIASQSQFLSAEVTGFGIPNQPELGWGATPQQAYSSTTSWAMVSYLSQAKYDFADRYFLSASVRADGSSRFGRNHQFGVFYALGGAWRLIEEEWMKDISWISNMKLRSSYGTSGNNSIGNFASYGLYGSGANYNGISGISPIQLPNPDIQWEKISAFNIGLETAFFNKLTLDLEYYHRRSDGLLFNKPLSAGTGFRSILTNLGAMNNSGIEASLQYTIVDKKDWYSNVGFNISTNNNKILNIETDQLVSGTKLLEAGGSIYQFYMREWAGVNPDNGKPMWYVNAQSDDKKENSNPASAFRDPHGSGREVTSDYQDAERVRLGTALPQFYGGLNYSLTYKNFDVSCYFYYSLGGQIYNNDLATNMHDGTQPGYNLAKEALNAWTPENRDTDVPRYVINNEDGGALMSSRFLEDASFLRLKNVAVSYNVPQRLINPFHLQNLKIFLSGENLWTLTNYKGFDPEGAINGTTNNVIPGVKSITMGIKVSL